MYSIVYMYYLHIVYVLSVYVYMYVYACVYIYIVYIICYSILYRIYIYICNVTRARFMQLETKHGAQARPRCIMQPTAGSCWVGSWSF
jgi:hypothetical protein